MHTNLEYCIQEWNPCLTKDIKQLERVQRRTTKLIPRLRNMSYDSVIEAKTVNHFKNLLDAYRKDKNGYGVTKDTA